MRAFSREHNTGGPPSNLEAREYINVLKLKAAKFDIITFTKIFPHIKVVHLQMDNMVALSYIKKYEGYQQQVSLRI